MGLDRRTFLQRAGLALFTWGATELGISSLVNGNRQANSLINYQQTLAQSTYRKLALLVGINRYPHQEDLAGCITDVELQRELLIHRFGFNPKDILVLSDRQATRENIETAFVEHLSQQAKPDDVVVFHFSGYGGQIKMPLSADEEIAAGAGGTDAFRLVNSFVPADGLPSGKKPAVANSILQETLLVLAQSLSTSKCTFVLDTSFSSALSSKHGSLKIRSLEPIAEGVSSPELAFLDGLKENLAVKGLKPSKRLLSLPGVVLSAAGKNQIAVERHWEDLSAGLFTQALTQHLWQIAPSSKIQVALVKTAETVERVMGKQQQPTINSPDKSAIAYYLATSDAPYAAGIISKTNNNGNLEVKLLGLPAHILARYGVNSCLSLGALGDAPQLQIKSREGIAAKAKLLAPVESVEVGQTVRESIRMLERDLSLKLALDENLQRIERVDATSALANIPAIASAVVSSEHNADCLLGKVPSTSTDESAADGSSERNPTYSYGLYTAGGNLIGKTTGIEEEAVKVAIERLQPHFNDLLAAKWLGLTDNEFSSSLKVGVTLTTGEKKQAMSWQKSTSAVGEPQPSSKKLPLLNNGSNVGASNGLPRLAKGAELKLRLNNYSDRPLYAAIIGIDPDCDLYALYTPAQLTRSEGEINLENIELSPEGELIIPASENAWQWKAPETAGISTLYIILSVRPFTETLKAFATQQNFKLDRQQILNVTNPVTVANSLMQDLHYASAVDSKLIPGEDVYALDVKSWASLSFVFEVTA